MVKLKQTIPGWINPSSSWFIPHLVNESFGKVAPTKSFFIYNVFRIQYIICWNTYLEDTLHPPNALRGGFPPAFTATSINGPSPHSPLLAPATLREPYRTPQVPNTLPLTSTYKRSRVCGCFQIHVKVIFYSQSTMECNLLSFTI